MLPRLSPLRCTASFVLAVSAVTQEPAPLEVFDAVYPIDGVAAHGDEVWWTCRAVDGIKGLPLPDAELLLIDESPTPMRGEFRYLGRVAADADGQLIPATITIGEFCEDVERTALLRRVVPGSHRVFVAAAGRRSAVASVEVPANGRAVIRARLPRR